MLLNQVCPQPVLRSSCGCTEPFVIIRAISPVSPEPRVGRGGRYLSFKLPLGSCPRVHNSLSDLSLGSSLRGVSAPEIYKPKFSVTTCSTSFFTLFKFQSYLLSSICRLFCNGTLFSYPTLWSKYTILMVIHWVLGCPFIIHLPIHSFTQHKFECARNFSFLSFGVLNEISHFIHSLGEIHPYVDDIHVYIFSPEL